MHVGQYCTCIATKYISETSALIDLEVTIDNNSKTDSYIDVITLIYLLDSKGNKVGDAVDSIRTLKTKIVAGASTKIKDSIFLKNPKLWGPLPSQRPNLYLAVTTLQQNQRPLDAYETRFGIRSLEFNPEKGLLVNGEYIYIKGVNQHHEPGCPWCCIQYTCCRTSA
ncbi:MAG TPA: hypothetical protein VIK07_09045 [Bacteroidales bacterium]